MALQYMVVCLSDFVIFPIMFTIVQFWETQAANDAFRQWAPMTLQGGGLYHMAMGAVLGITAWSRGQEKIAGVANTPVAPLNPGATQPVVSQQYSQQSYARQEPQFISVSVGYGGKTAPPKPDYPEL
jgi:hypothetical protein